MSQIGYLKALIICIDIYLLVLQNFRKYLVYANMSERLSGSKRDILELRQSRLIWFPSIRYRECQ